MDRDSLIKLYFSLGMTYQDMLTTLALQGIIVSKRQLGAVHFMLQGEKPVCWAGSLCIHLSRAHELIKIVSCILCARNSILSAQCSKTWPQNIFSLST